MKLEEIFVAPFLNHAIQKSAWKTWPLMKPLLAMPFTDQQQGLVAGAFSGSVTWKVPAEYTQPPSGKLPVPELTPQMPPTTVPALLMPKGTVTMLPPLLLQASVPGASIVFTTLVWYQLKA